MLTHTLDGTQHDVVLTIGHSTHPIDTFLDLLSRNGVTAVCDVRSTPFSRTNPQFTRDNLRSSLLIRGIAYVFLGQELGARSQDPSCYINGRVEYDRLACTEHFQAGLRRVHEGIKKYRIALMCAERDPLQCHRTILVSRHLVAGGLAVQHITGDGQLESHADVMRRLVRQLGLPEHDLFRSTDDLVEDAYRIQGERIAYVPSATTHDGHKAREGVSR